jgi:hypothetical protein
MRERWAIGHSNTSCGGCGYQALVPTESQLVRRGLARLRQGFDADRRVYELCEDCGAKHAVQLGA